MKNNKNKKDVKRMYNGGKWPQRNTCTGNTHTRTHACVTGHHEINAKHASSEKSPKIVKKSLTSMEKDKITATCVKKVTRMSENCVKFLPKV